MTLTEFNFHNGRGKLFCIKQVVLIHIFFCIKFTELLESKNNYNLVFSNKYNVNKYKHKSIDGNIEDYAI